MTFDGLLKWYWDCAPEWANWLGIDLDGRCWYYEEEPVWSESAQMYTPTGFGKIQLAFFPYRYLCARPEEETGKTV